MKVSEAILGQAQRKGCRSLHLDEFQRHLPYSNDLRRNHHGTYDAG